MTKTRGLLSALLTVAALSFSGCGGGSEYVIEGGQQLYLQTNLPYDTANGRMESILYNGHDRVGWVNACTPVTIERVNDRQIVFVSQQGQRFTYLRSNHSRVPIADHVNRYFGPGCPDTASMAGPDQMGIRDHQIYEGMSKAGVLIAIGYPPEHQTPSLEGDVWKYWKNRYNTFEVYFVGGLVSGIRD